MLFRATCRDTPARLYSQVLCCFLLPNSQNIPPDSSKLHDWPFVLDVVSTGVSKPAPRVPHRTHYLFNITFRKFKIVLTIARFHTMLIVSSPVHLETCSPALESLGSFRNEGLSSLCFVLPSSWGALIQISCSYLSCPQSVLVDRGKNIFLLADEDLHITHMLSLFA